MKICYRAHTPGVAPDVLFGGVFGVVNGVAVMNPATGDQSCAPNFIKSSVYGGTTPKDNEVFMCHKSQGSAPPNITNLAAGTVTANSIPLTWTSGGGNTVNYLVAYQPGDVAPSRCNGGIVTGNVTSTTLTGLTFGTKYSIRVCAADAFLTPSAGLTLTVTTSNLPAPNEITGLLATSSASGSVNLKWTSGGGYTSSFIFQRVAGVVPPPSCLGGVSTALNTSYIDTGLLPNTMYSYRVCSVNAAGATSPGLTTTVTTLDATAASFADNFNRADSTSLGAPWTEVSGDMGILLNTLAGKTAASSTSVISDTAANVTVEGDYSSTIVSLSSFVGLVVRYLGPGENNQYRAQVRFTSTPSVTLMRNVNGTWTNLKSTSTSVPKTGRLSLTAIGSTLTVKINGNVKLSATDSSLATAGKTGVMMLSTGARLDNFTVTNQ